MVEKIELPPEAGAMIESTRSLGYSFHDAVADIIDNSVSAGAENIELVCDYDCAEPFLSVFDDGCGMDDEELRSAMTYGSKNPLDARRDDDLGRFGLGLKVASLSQCSRLTVLSKKNDEINGYCWDLDEVRRDNQWIVIVVDYKDICGMQIEKLEASETGTLVIWQNFDKLSKGAESVSSAMRTRLQNTRYHLSLVYHRYLAKSGPMSDARNITIRMNGYSLKPRDPFLTSNSLTIPKINQRFSYHGKEIQVQGFIIPHINQLSDEEIENLGGRGKMLHLQGFYVYRNKRLILPGGTWFKLSGKKQLQNLARIMIDLPNDLDAEWSVDVKKASVNLPEDFKNQLKVVLKDVLTTSKRVYTKRGKTAIGSENRMIVRRDRKDYVTYEINRDHPFIKSLLENPEVSYEFQTVLSMIEHSIPYDDIRNDFEERLKPNALTDDERDAYIRRGMVYLDCTDGNLSELATKEPYSIHPELIEELRGRGYK